MATISALPLPEECFQVGQSMKKGPGKSELMSEGEKVFATEVEEKGSISRTRIFEKMENSSSLNWFF